MAIYKSYQVLCTNMQVVRYPTSRYVSTYTIVQMQYATSTNAIRNREAQLALRTPLFGGGGGFGLHGQDALVTAGDQALLGNTFVRTEILLISISGAILL